MPTNLICYNPECGKTFPHLAKRIKPIAKDPDDLVEIPVCPFCHEPYIAMQEEPAEAPSTAVYVADLVSGDNQIIATLLAEGWKITARYAKQFILEKYPIREAVLEKLKEAEQ